MTEKEAASKSDLGGLIPLDNTAAFRFFWHIFTPRFESFHLLLECVVFEMNVEMFYVADL
jgi:hypothetical protein